MSEMINAQRRNENFRRNLLTNASVLALLGYLGTSQGSALAADETRPVIWIELGGQLDRLGGGSEVFAPPFFAQASSTDRGVMTDAQASLPYSIGSEGKITFAPEASDWVFSAAVRYGRSNGVKHLHHQGAIPATNIWTRYGYKHYFVPVLDTLGDAQTRSQESHAILDFQAGKDVGLGMFGGHGSSVISAGVRFAQFTSGVHATLQARPVAGFGPPATDPGYYRNLRWFEHATYKAVAHSERSAHAVGPSIAWDASAPVVGDGSDATFNFDWGVNAAVLFGRQRAQVHHQTTGYHFSRTGGFYSKKHIKTYSYAHAPADQNRARTAAIPNVGGFAGVSFRYLDAKVSFGYRGDFFFGAMDGGIDTAKKENVGFYGPFASISVGLGG